MLVNDGCDVMPVTMIKMGCQAWSNIRPKCCPACGSGIHLGDDRIYCACCDSLSPRLEVEVRIARRRTKVRADDKLRLNQCQAEVDRLGGGRPAGGKKPPKEPRLSERRRRYIVLEYGAIGEAWLRTKGQLPDWSQSLPASRRTERVR